MEEKSPKVAEESTLQLSIWETMVSEERKLEAERRGIRVCDLEEETSLFQALEDSELVVGNVRIDGGDDPISVEMVEAR